MTEQQQPYPSEEPARATPEPAAASPAAEQSEQSEQKQPSKARRFLAGAMLVTVGVVAGAGTTYAFTANDGGSTQQGQFSGRGGPNGGFPGYGMGDGRDGQGGPPGMNGQDGQQGQGQQQGTAPSAAPSTQPG